MEGMQDIELDKLDSLLSTLSKEEVDKLNAEMDPLLEPGVSNKDFEAIEQNGHFDTDVAVKEQLSKVQSDLSVATTQPYEEKTSAAPEDSSYIESPLEEAEVLFTQSESPQVANSPTEGTESSACQDHTSSDNFEKVADIDPIHNSSILLDAPLEVADSSGVEEDQVNSVIESVSDFVEDSTSAAQEVIESEEDEVVESAMSSGDSVVATTSPPLVEGEATNGMDALDSGDDLVDKVTEDCQSSSLREIDSEEDEGINEEVNSGASVAPSNTPVNGGSGQTSPVMQSSSDSLSDDVQKLQKAAVTAAASAKKSVLLKSAVDEPKSRAAIKEAKKEEKKKNKKKEDKSIEYILRALNSLQTPEEKLAALCKKYADLHEEHRVLQTSFKTQQRTMAVVMREKDQLQSEHTKAMMAKSKLESLCRELQKQNKIIKDESIKRAREEDERRKEISAQFQSHSMYVQTTIGEIQTQMTDNTERNSKLRQENAELAVQLQSIIKQCDTREQQIDKVRKQHDLEQQLADAKLSKAELQLKEERERNAREKELLVGKFTEQAKKNSMLEAQVEMFKERYDDFEKLHSRSSETFQKYKTEMDKMTKRIKKLEKDGSQWKQKFENSQKSLVESLEGRNKAEKETITYVQRCKKLESLCRALQGELHGKKPAEEEKKPAPSVAAPTAQIPKPAEAAESSGSMDDIDPVSTDDALASSAPPNSPESSSADQCGPEETNPPSSIADSAAKDTATTAQISSTTSPEGELGEPGASSLTTSSSSPSSSPVVSSTTDLSSSPVSSQPEMAQDNAPDSGATSGVADVEVIVADSSDGGEVTPVETTAPEVKDVPSTDPSKGPSITQIDTEES